MNTKLNNWFLLSPENNISKVGIFNEFYDMKTYFIFNYLLDDDDYNRNIYMSGYCGSDYYNPYNKFRDPYSGKPMLGPLQDNKTGSGTVHGYFDETAELLEYRTSFRYFAFSSPDGQFYDLGDKLFINEFYDGSGCATGAGDKRGRN